MRSCVFVCAHECSSQIQTGLRSRAPEHTHTHTHTHTRTHARARAHTHTHGHRRTERQKHTGRQTDRQTHLQIADLAARVLQFKRQSALRRRVKVPVPWRCWSLTSTRTELKQVQHDLRVLQRFGLADAGFLKKVFPLLRQPAEAELVRLVYLHVRDMLKVVWQGDEGVPAAIIHCIALVSPHLVVCRQQKPRHILQVVLRPVAIVRHHLLGQCIAPSLGQTLEGAVGCIVLNMHAALFDSKEDKWSSRVGPVAPALLTWPWASSPERQLDQKSKHPPSWPYHLPRWLDSSYHLPSREIGAFSKQHCYRGSLIAGYTNPFAGLFRRCCKSKTGLFPATFGSGHRSTTVEVKESVHQPCRPSNACMFLVLCIVQRVRWD